MNHIFLLVALYSFLLKSTYTDQVIIVEAEDFISQEKNDIRSWKVINAAYLNTNPGTYKGLSTASGGAYVEILPDTRVTHDDPLEVGVNFSNEPGVMGVLNYKVNIPTAGRYYIWVKAFSSGTEDNGLHVGIDDTWPESGQRLQWCEGKHKWTWDSKQRTKEVHCGVPELIYLDVTEAGEHTISFSMREDGFEFDQWALTTKYQRPE